MRLIFTPDRSLYKPRVMVAWIVVGAFAAIFLLAITWYGLMTVLEAMYGGLQTTFPTEMDDPGMTFMNAVITYFTALSMFGILIWVYVQSQKPPGVRG